MKIINEIMYAQDKIYKKIYFEQVKFERVFVLAGFKIYDELKSELTISNAVIETTELRQFIRLPRGPVIPSVYIEPDKFVCFPQSYFFDLMKIKDLF